MERADPRAWRVNGALFVVVLVALGFGATAVIFRWRARDLGMEFERTRASMPEAPEERLQRWTDYGRPLIHKRLVQLRYSPSEPWLLTHTAGGERNSAQQEVWGVDLTGLDEHVTRCSGLDVIVTLPAPRLLRRGPIGGDTALHVPHVASGAPFDVESRARGVVEWSVELLTKALARDVPEARFQVRFADPAADARGVRDG